MHGEDFVRELYDASYRRLVGQLFVVTGSREEADDVVQEAFALVPAGDRVLALGGSSKDPILVALDARGHSTPVAVAR